MSTVTVNLPFGSKNLKISLPKDNVLALASPTVLKSPPDATKEIRRALRDPIGMVRFGEMVHSGDRVVIIVDDTTRPTPAYLILPPLLEELQADQLRLHVQILVALATHRQMSPAEIEAKIGPEIAARYEVIQHDGSDRKQLVDLGTTPNGTPIEINRQVVEADVSIGIGNICAHPLAGWGGGGKIVQPGVSSDRTTEATHFLAGQVPGSSLGNVLNNPVRLEMEEVARRVGLTGIVNTVLDGSGAIVRVVVGDVVTAHRRGVEIARAIWQLNLPALADIVIVSSHPSDIDYWQACKGVFCAENVVKRGGDIILVTPSPERITTNSAHLQTLKTLSGVHSRDMPRVARQLHLADLNAVGCAMLMHRVNETASITVVSDGLTPEDCAILGHDHAPSIEQALESAFSRQGPDATITILTHGGESYAVVASGDRAGSLATGTVSEHATAPGSN